MIKNYNIVFGLFLLLVVMIPLSQNVSGLRNDKLVFTEPIIDSVKITLLDNTYITDNRIQLIRDVVMSDESYMIDDNIMHKGLVGVESEYFLGWHGALNSITDIDFQFNIGKRIEGDIVIILNEFKHPGGLDGNYVNYGKLSIVTIYGVEELNSSRLQTIVRHELGHAFGIAHTTATEELMNEFISTPFPYISPCMISGLTMMYDGHSNETIRCEK